MFLELLKYIHSSGDSSCDVALHVHVDLWLVMELMIQDSASINNSCAVMTELPRVFNSVDSITN